MAGTSAGGSPRLESGCASPGRLERTIVRTVEVTGISFLRGLDVRLRFQPAEPGHGLVFRRVDRPGRPRLPARVDHVVPRQRRTTIQCGEVVVEMVEHVLAALAGLHIDNCLIDIDQPETPGCDGSSLAFVEALNDAGIVEQDRQRQVLVIDHPINVGQGNHLINAYPGGDGGLTLGYQLNYGAENPIGRQSQFVTVTPETFFRDLASSRTFVLEAEADALRQAGIGARTTEKDLLIFGPRGPIGNSLRFDDEPARHKLLDLVGDLALVGADIDGHVIAHRSGHQLNVELARALVSQEKASSTPPRPAGTSLASTTNPKLQSSVVPPSDRHQSGWTIDQIRRILPHRYPFLLVDRVDHVEPGRRIVAIKNVSVNEPYFQGHWPDRPVMPGVLIVEALAQAAGLLYASGLASLPDDASGRQACLIVGLDRTRLRRPIVPGDRVHLEAEIQRRRLGAFETHCRALVDGQVAAETRIRFVVVPESQLDRPAAAVPPDIEAA